MVRYIDITGPNTILIDTRKTWICSTDIKQKYEEICKKYREKPRRSTQLWHNLQYLKNLNLIEIKVNSKNQKGRTSMCSINNIPLETLEEELSQKIKSYKFEGY